MAEDVEEPMSGGRWTSGVVRVGDTVRRPASAASGFVARLLNHLSAQGFDGCPRYLGRDAQGRDILSYLPGAVVPRWQRFADDQVTAAAVLLRGMHDASVGLARALGGGEVVCHHDPAPNNTLFQAGQPWAFIDFDFAAAGERLEDVAYLAWSWCISSKPERGPASGQARQVRLAADAYGLTPAGRAGLTAAIEERLRRNESFWSGVKDDDRAPPGPRARAVEVIDWTRREMAHVRAHRDAFRGALA